MLLCLGFFFFFIPLTTFEKLEIGTFSLVLSELLTASSRCVRAARQGREHMTQGKVGFY